METLDKNYWQKRWLEGSTRWDLKMPSPPIIEFAKSLIIKDLRILMPGAGSAHEPVWLVENGFKNVSIIDISSAACEVAKTQLEGRARVICGDFFELKDEFDLILEQTFFCALEPRLRPFYVEKMHELLAENGRLAGLLFDRIFEADGPPFGGSILEYRLLFEPFFEIEKLEPCRNSAESRAGTEAFFVFRKR